MDKTKNKNEIPEEQYYRTLKNRCCRKLLKIDEKTEREILEKVNEILEQKIRN